MRTLGIVMLAGLGVASGLHADAPRDYFPLAVGNQWIYQGVGIWSGTFVTLEITQSHVFNGNRYYLLHGLPQQDYWLREDDKGSVWNSDPDQAAPRLWWDFRSPAGRQYTTFLPGVCCGAAMVNSPTAEYQGPIGQFQDALEILYPGVFQVGIERELFLPGVGLVYRNQATGGPSYGAWDLVYARVGGVTVHPAWELSFSLALDNSIYTVNMMPPVPVPVPAPLMTARITLRNTAQPVTLVLPSGQNYDLEIRDAKGTVVYRWSDGKAFTMIFRTETFGPGEKNFMVQVPLAGSDKNPLPAGKYIAEAWLATQEKKIYAASVAFEIRRLDAAAPAPVSLSPAVSSGANRVFNVAFNAPGGYQTLDVVNVLINNVLDGRHACYLAYSRLRNTLYIVADNGDATQLSGKVMDANGTVGNSQCMAMLNGSSVTGGGNTLTLALNLNFAESFAGNKAVYAAARDLDGNNSGWHTMGVHSVPPLAVRYPNPVRMVPPSGAAPSQAITFLYQDQSNAANLETVWALINTAIDGRGACYVGYYRPGNLLYLYPDDGDGTLAANVALAGNHTIANSQCSISAQGASAQTIGNTLALTLPVTFKPAFAGFKAVWLAAQTVDAQTSPWQALGAWKVPVQ